MRWFGLISAVSLHLDTLVRFELVSMLLLLGVVSVHSAMIVMHLQGLVVGWWAVTSSHATSHRHLLCFISRIVWNWRHKDLFKAIVEIVRVALLEQHNCISRSWEKNLLA